eukprot:1446791-Rhodomonas_salina.1
MHTYTSTRAKRLWSADREQNALVVLQEGVYDSMRELLHDVDIQADALVFRLPVTEVLPLLLSLRHDA